MVKRSGYGADFEELKRIAVHIQHGEIVKSAGLRLQCTVRMNHALALVFFIEPSEIGDVDFAGRASDTGGSGPPGGSVGTDPEVDFDRVAFHDGVVVINVTEIESQFAMVKRDRPGDVGDGYGRDRGT